MEDFIKDKSPIQMLSLTATLFASASLIRIAYKTINSKNNSKAQENMYKSIIEKKQAARNSSIQEIAMQNGR